MIYTGAEIRNDRPHVESWIYQNVNDGRSNMSISSMPLQHAPDQGQQSTQQQLLALQTQNDTLRQQNMSLMQKLLLYERTFGAMKEEFPAKTDSMESGGSPISPNRGIDSHISDGSPLPPIDRPPSRDRQRVERPPSRTVRDRDLIMERAIVQDARVQALSTVHDKSTVSSDAPPSTVLPGETHSMPA